MRERRAQPTSCPQGGSLTPNEADPHSGYLWMTFDPQSAGQTLNEANS